MKIQKQLSKKRGNKIYYRYVVTIPEEVLRESGIKEGDDVEVKASNGNVVLEKKLSK